MQAHAHARKAAEETQHANWAEAADEYQHAASDFSRAARDTTDSEVSEATCLPSRTTKADGGKRPYEC